MLNVWAVPRDAVLTSTLKTYPKSLKPYTNAFYDETQMISVRSAEQIVPLVLDLLDVQSAVDLGCGTGSWLSVFARHGVPEILGVDGGWAGADDLLIPKVDYLVHDLKQPLKLERRFDLVISLEVAEHLPESCAASFVRSLTDLGPVVLFSAAVPFQGGTNHINEQWPEYWARHFMDLGYQPVDCFRNKIWQNENVAYWFAQNLLLFVKTSYLNNSPRLLEHAGRTEPDFLSRVHPKMFLKSREALSSPKAIIMRKLWNLLPRSVRVRLIKYLAHHFWEQVSAKYTAGESVS